MSLYENWREEKNSAWLYRLVAEYELDTVRKNMFLELATAADRQATLWEAKLKKPGVRARRSVLCPVCVPGLLGYWSDGSERIAPDSFFLR